MAGQLFTGYFLTEGIKTTPEWEAWTSPEADLGVQLRQVYEKIRTYNQPNEAVTEDDLIIPVLKILGWTDLLAQQGSGHNQDIPDYLLFADAQSKDRATARLSAEQRYTDALVVVENKRFGLHLDRRDKIDSVQSSTPHSQILHYLSVADTVSEGNIRWGILTNGSLWRLYDRRTSPRATAYFEIDLGTTLESVEDTKLFTLIFGRDSFTPQSGANASFLEFALGESQSYEERVAQDLSSVVFEKVFPNLIQALTDASKADLGTAREAALIFLYRMFFLLYAEDRGLLPVHDMRYEEYGLRRSVREDIARRMESETPFSETVSRYYDHVMALCRMVDKGEASIGMPPYNGGLFSSESAPLLEEVRLSDAAIAPIIHNLSHVKDDSGTLFVNYRDMSVQQLGSIYERLLEREPVRDSDGTITVKPNSFARKDTGSYFTPQELVDLIIDRTLSPLITERLAAFETKGKDLADDLRPTSERLAELTYLDPAEAVLDLKVLDPAMGSGHFLVTAVDFLSDRISELAEHTPSVPEWTNGEYTSPLVERIDTIREGIIQRAKESHWTIDEAQLTDQTIIRRMVLKRCIYGVDKNPLTVELAKVSLWLHSFTAGSPLSFLDHHLRHGDSLVGMNMAEATGELRRLMVHALFARPAIVGAEAATAKMRRIEEINDADISDVRESESLFQEVKDATAGPRSLMDTLNGIRWLTSGMNAKQRKDIEISVGKTLEKEPAQAYAILQNGLDIYDPAELDESSEAFSDLWKEARAIAEREAFLHWEAAFPNVWGIWNGNTRQGGFDAVIGNPPWDRIKLQEVEWFAARSSDLALAQTASERKAGIQKLRDIGAALAVEFDKAKEQSEQLGHLVRRSGQYPMLSGGDINLYSLFVERAMSLVKPEGIVGLLTPSGIYADKTAAEFFKSISTSGRLAGLFDFENRRLGTDLHPFFPDVDSRFKFCAVIFGGEHRRFLETECAFFLHNTETVNDPNRCFPLAPEDFARANPNTGTAPIFRTRRDADITRFIYERHPVLVDQSQEEERRAWPVRYNRMFDMTNDSHLFRTAAQLDSDGFIPVPGNFWKKGDELYLPLYQGRMIHQFDHRFNSVRVNPENTHNPYLSEEVTEEQHSDPNFLPQTQYWVQDSSIEPVIPLSRGHAIGFRDIARPTDARTAIFSIVPRAGYGNTLPLLMCDEQSMPAFTGSLIVANLNTLCLDFILRQKIQGTHMNLYILEQLPVIALDDYDRQFGVTTARELVRDHVLRLTYTAHDMTPFAKEMGYDGQPFTWDEEERRHLRARLDALYFHLYGISREDADYILSTFPIIKREDEKEFKTYLTRKLILGYMNALEAGDTEAKVAG